MTQELLNIVADMSQVIPIAKTLAEELRPKDRFCLWLTGDLGVGKTTFAGILLHELGLPRDVPVLSPTFTYMTEYEFDRKKVAHMDLYRLIEGDDDSLEVFFADRVFWGVIVEWPEKCPQAPKIAPTHRLEISFVSNDKRRYRLVKQ